MARQRTPLSVVFYDPGCKHPNYSHAQGQTLAEQLSFLHYPRPFKNPNYTKNVNRRTKNLKTVLTQERERERAERDRRRQEKEEQERMADDAMDVDTTDNPNKEKNSVSSSSRSAALDEDVPTCEYTVTRNLSRIFVGADIRNGSVLLADTSIEAPPSLLPPRHYCDITGLEAPYTDPRTGLRYHDKSVYELIKGLSPSVAKDYLAARGVNPIVK
ncbi:hypothetical protein EDC04DRAFT_2889653 [Pisolithus marmoratus]|nr:hypothetical protein EDC04DRAFT_2889653 [Pisolithus marmoratus]